MSASAPCTLSVISAEEQEGKPDHQPGAVKGRPVDIPPKGTQTPGALHPHFENRWFRGTLQAVEGACCWLFPGGSWRRWDLAGWEGGETQPRSGASARPVGEAASKGGVGTRNAVNPNGEEGRCAGLWGNITSFLGRGKSQSPLLVPESFHTNHNFHTGPQAWVPQFWLCVGQGRCPLTAAIDFTMPQYARDDAEDTELSATQHGVRGCGWQSPRGLPEPGGAAGTAAGRAGKVLLPQHEA